MRASKSSDEAENAKSQAKEEIRFNPFIFLPAAILHQGSRCLVFMALIFTTASSYQILSGSLVIFTCILSKIFLKKVLSWYKWIGVTVILVKKLLNLIKLSCLLIVGVAIVGVGDLIFDEEEALNAILGDIFAVSAMVFWAAQLNYEEKYVKKYNIKPMKALGLKGMFSFFILTPMLVGFYFLPFNMGQGQTNRHVLEDAIDGFIQLGNNPILLVSCISKWLYH